MLVCSCLAEGVSSGRRENLSAKYSFKMGFYIIKNAAVSTSAEASVGPGGASTVIQVLFDTLAKSLLLSAGEHYRGSVHHHAPGSHSLQKSASSTIPALGLAW